MNPPYQIGNITFATFFFIGLINFLTGLRESRFDMVMARFLIYVLTFFAALCVVAVSTSWLLLDTNWFLRLINYGILFASILAAIGLEKISRSWNFWHVLLWGCIVITSLISVLRPPPLLAC